MGIEHLKPLENVVELNLYYAEYLTDTALAHLRGWKHLEVLNLRGVRLTSQAFEHLCAIDLRCDLLTSRSPKSKTTALSSCPR